MELGLDSSHITVRVGQEEITMDFLSYVDTDLIFWCSILALAAGLGIAIIWIIRDEHNAHRRLKLEHDAQKALKAENDAYYKRFGR